MNNTKHTPGPWTVRVDKNIGRPRVAGEPKDNGKRDVVAVFPLGMDEEIASANARLIAAAPEMLEALRAVAEFWPDKTKVHPDVRILLASVNGAIAKATGGLK